MLSVLLLLACGAPSQPVVPVVDAPPAAASTAETEAVMFPVGTACSPVPDGAPTTVEEVQAALIAAGISPVGVEQMPVCKACKTCPLTAFSVTVSAADVAPTQALSAGWKE